MKNFVLLLTFILSLQLSYAQHPTCDGTRYLDTVFTTVDTFIGVQFGINTTIAGASDTLLMDIYQPQGDLATNRPLIILAFGGSFILGERQDLGELCYNYARQGYVAATIDYRLYDGPLFPIPDSTVIADEVMKAVSDMKASIRFFREDAATSNLYKIDSNIIFIGGGSAGAVTADHVAYLDPNDNIPAYVQTAINNNGGFHGNTTTNIQYSTEVSGVLNFSGGLQRAGWINSGEAPLFSAHDDGDGIVPYEQGYATAGPFDLIYMEGSKIMHDSALVANVQSQLITVPNSTGHVSYQSAGSPFRDSVFLGSSQFMHDIICPTITSFEPIASENNPYTALAYPNPSQGDMYIQVSELPSNYALTAFDQTGRLVYQKENINQQETVLYQQDFAAGLYFVRIQFEDTTIPPITTKVIFQK
ncbi:MAG: T9SS type A sorting domain-containing protein [Aureispira sp.]|nr:T9SS type A sorting domain-containing protein [Aureispira sp.]